MTRCECVRPPARAKGAAIRYRHDSHPAAREEDSNLNAV